MLLVMITAGLVLAVVAVLIVRELRGVSAMRLATSVGPSHDDDLDITKVGRSPGGPVSEVLEEPSLTVYQSDSDIGIDEPTGPVELILESAAGQSDRGLRRRRNEDSYLVLPDHSVYVVADGMGGYAGGDVASRIAIETISSAFTRNEFVGEPNPSRPRRGNELVWTIEAANRAILHAALANQEFHGMGTTLLAARFLRKKQRVFIGHVGDSRCYRLRDGELMRLTNDHTLGASGVKGPYAEHLSRALGIAERLTVDLIIDTPKPGDVFVLCTDGLTKMVPDERLQDVLREGLGCRKTVEVLIDMANQGGGRDNITVILVAVKEPRQPSLHLDS